MVCSQFLTTRPIKIDSTELYEGVHTAQRQTYTKSLIGFCVNLLYLSVSIFMSASVSDNVNTPQDTCVVISMEKTIVKYIESKIEGFLSVTCVGYTLVPARSLPSRFSDLLPAL